MKNYIFFFSILLLTFILTGCADTPSCEAVARSSEHGFLWGLAHGIVFPLALLSKLFGVDYGLYAVDNTGFWYWLGYLIGIGGLSGGANSARRR